jgi:hypothetical protein
MNPGKNTFCGLRRILHSDSFANSGTEWLLWDPFRILAPGSFIILASGSVIILAPGSVIILAAGSVIILFRSRSKSLPFVATSWSGVSVKR